MKDKEGDWKKSALVCETDNMLDQTDSLLQWKVRWMKGEHWWLFISALVGLLTVPHIIMLDKLLKCGLDKWMVIWTENWLGWVIISSVKPSRRPATNDVPQSLYYILYCQRLLLVVWIMGNRDVVCKFADDTKLGEVILYTRGLCCHSRDVDRVEK